MTDFHFPTIYTRIGCGYLEARKIQKQKWLTSASLDECIVNKCQYPTVWSSAFFPLQKY